jgi:hypothetical protein
MQRLAQGLFLAGALATAGCDVAGVSPAAALVSGEHGITAIAADGSFVYWSTIDGTVKRISIDGGEPVTLVAGGGEVSSGAANLQVDAQNVYWTTSSAVATVAKSGGTPTILAGETVALSELTGLTVNDENDFVYFTETAGFVRKAPKAVGDTITLASGEASPTSPVVRGASLYWAAETPDGSATDVRLMGVEGGAPASVSMSEPSTFGQISVDDSNVYWASNGVVSWVPLVGGDNAQIAPAQSSAGDGTAPPEIPIVLGDDTDVYWSDVVGDVSTAQVIPGVTADVLVTGPAGLVSLALDSVNLYWANSADGTVVVMPKSFAMQSASATPTSSTNETGD